LHSACKNGNVNIIATLLYQSADINIIDISNKTPFEAIDSLLEKDIILQIEKLFQYNQEERRQELLAEEVDKIPLPTEDSPLQILQQKLVIPQPISDSSQTKPVTIDMLIDLIPENGKMPSIEVFKSHCDKLDPRLINQHSSKEKCSLFWWACRIGSYDIVKYLFVFPGIKKDGVQETREFGNGSTPLHIANWKGHVHIVALLLYNKVPVEQNKKGFPPGSGQEINTKLPNNIQIALSSLFSIEKDRNLKLQDKQNEYRIIFNKKDEKAQQNTRLPLTDKLYGAKQIPYHYSVCNFFWFDAKSNELLDISVCSSLDLAYNIYKRSGGIIQKKVWYENSLREWSIDFTNKTKFFAKQTEPPKQIFLRHSQRATNFYYKDKDNIWVPLSLSSNYKIRADRPHVKTYIQENMKTTGMLDKIFKNSRVQVELQNKKLYFRQEVYDIKCEQELDYHWPYENPREFNEKVPHEKLPLDDPEFIKVKDAFKLTMPQKTVKTVTRYFLPEYETFLNLNKKMQYQDSYEVKDKLLWSWDFTASPYKYDVNKNEKNNPYGPGYQFASSANIAVNLRKKKSKILVLGVVLIGNPFYITLANKNGLGGLEAGGEIEDFNSLACYYDSEDGVTGWIYVVPDDQRILPMYVIHWE